MVKWKHSVDFVALIWDLESNVPVCKNAMERCAEMYDLLATATDDCVKAPSNYGREVWARGIVEMGYTWLIPLAECKRYAMAAHARKGHENDTPILTYADVFQHGAWPDGFRRASALRLMSRGDRGDQLGNAVVGQICLLAGNNGAEPVKLGEIARVALTDLGRSIITAVHDGERIVEQTAQKPHWRPLEHRQPVLRSLWDQNFRNFKNYAKFRSDVKKEAKRMGYQDDKPVS